MRLLWLRPYTPEHNAIENYWAVVKKRFRGEMMTAGMRLRDVYIRELLAPLMWKVNRDSIHNMCSAAIRRILAA